jgi:hypothetical protein
LITGNTRAPVPTSAVKVYEIIPVNEELIGIVEAKSSRNWSRVENQENAL